MTESQTAPHLVQTPLIRRSAVSSVFRVHRGPSLPGLVRQHVHLDRIGDAHAVLAWSTNSAGHAILCFERYLCLSETKAISGLQAMLDGSLPATEP